ncbi:MAG TPA: hypothetical protein VF516_15255 [Kofleriaceae bacterium]
MVRTDYVLAVMAAAQVPLSPVEVQKLFFILDKKAGAQLGGPFFNFTPYAYGPFDAAVYHELERLAERGLASIYGQSTTCRYGISAAGLKPGAAALGAITMSGYISQVAEYVRSSSFAQLILAVYAEWPEMMANSIFQGYPR